MLKFKRIAAAIFPTPDPRRGKLNLGTVADYERWRDLGTTGDVVHGRVPGLGPVAYVHNLALHRALARLSTFASENGPVSKPLEVLVILGLLGVPDLSQPGEGGGLLFSTRRDVHDVQAQAIRNGVAAAAHTPIMRTHLEHVVTTVSAPDYRSSNVYRDIEEGLFAAVFSQLFGVPPTDMHQVFEAYQYYGHLQRLPYALLGDKTLERLHNRQGFWGKVVGVASRLPLVGKWVRHVVDDPYILKAKILGIFGNWIATPESPTDTPLLRSIRDHYRAATTDTERLAVLVQFTIAGLAGLDTVACLLSECILRMAERPDLQAALREAKDPLEYAKWVVLEVGRSTPPAPGTLVRALRDFSVDYTDANMVPCTAAFKAGETITTNFVGIGSNSRYFPNPEVFDPARIANATQQSTAKTLLFSSGGHACPGQELAMHIVATTLRDIVLKTELRFDGTWSRTVSAMEPVQRGVVTGTPISPGSAG